MTPTREELAAITRETLSIFDGQWVEYRKVPTTKMVRMNGPFTVQTREGHLTCDDGFLAVDSGGYPYPIAADEHARIYELATNTAESIGRLLDAERDPAYLRTDPTCKPDLQVADPWENVADGLAEALDGCLSVDSPNSKRREKCRAALAHYEALQAQPPNP